MLLTLLGCIFDDSDSAGACASEEPAVEVGQTMTDDGGTQVFVAAEEGASSTIIHGPQGGWHILASARVTNTDPIVTIHYTVTVGDDGPIVSDNTYRVQLVEDGECAGYYPGMYGYLDVSALAVGDADTPPELLAGETLTLVMEVSDVNGRTAQDTLHVVATLDPADA